MNMKSVSEQNAGRKMPITFLHHPDQMPVDLFSKMVPKSICVEQVKKEFKEDHKPSAIISDGDIIRKRPKGDTK